MKDPNQRTTRPLPVTPAPGFTLIELLVVVAVIGVLSSLLLPALAKAKARGRSVFCLNNAKQLDLAWLMYAHENSDRLAYNLGATEIRQILARREAYNWANSIMSWELESENTNILLNTDAALGSYLARNPKTFKCPADTALSTLQRKAGWAERSRSYSMNAMVGDAGVFTTTGSNVNNPYYRQFLKLGDVSAPSDIFVFIDEHPDSINDGYFLNRATAVGWIDLPASYHNGAANLAYVDGHVESHHWIVPSTKPPAEPDSANLPFALGDNERADFLWLMRRTSTYVPDND